jgi:hypothetical protein
MTLENRGPWWRWPEKFDQELQPQTGKIPLFITAKLGKLKHG